MAERQETHSVTLYLSGPMSGLPEFNYPAFTSAAKILRSQGHAVVSPHELPADCPGCLNTGYEHSWSEHMRVDLAALLTCDVIVMLPGWQQSRGALLEKSVAEAIGLMVIDYSVISSS